MTDKPDGKRRGWSFCLLALASLAAGCDQETNVTPEEAKALSIARAAIAKHPEMRDFVEFDKPSGNPVTGYWRVTVWRDPKVQGGFISIDIDRNGKVTGISHGK